MKKISFTYWRDGKFYIGFLNQYPDYQTRMNAVLKAFRDAHKS